MANPFYVAYCLFDSESLTGMESMVSPPLSMSPLALLSLPLSAFG